MDKDFLVKHNGWNTFVCSLPSWAPQNDLKGKGAITTEDSLTCL